MFTKNQILIVTISSILFIAVAFFLIPYLVTNKSWWWAYDDTTGVIGDTIGGIVGPFVGFVGVVLTFFAFYIQYQANQIQVKSLKEQSDLATKSDRQIKVQHLESNFFRMIEYHNQNVNQIKITNLDSTKTDISEGRRAFVQFKIQIHRLLPIVNAVNSENELKLTREQILDITYIIFYYGIDGSWVNFITEKLSRYPNSSLIAAKVAEKISKTSNLKLARTNQTNLSTYFRNMYNAIKLIDQNEILTEKEKQNLIKIYRAQLSNPELYVIFFNILSRFGKKWIDKDYIIKYELLKNIPKNYCDGYEPSDYFKILYEDDEY
ncbi:MAG: putative phage abortive infection protein [Bacteroidia bacterium]